MSLEFALEKYPVEVTLGGGGLAVVRLLKPEDGDEYFRFLSTIPEEERLLIKERVGDRQVFDEWLNSLDVETDTTLLVVNDSKIIAEGNLHQRTGGWKRHIGRIGVLVHPNHRGIGISRALVEHLVNLARHGGLSKAEAEFNGEREIAIRSFSAMGFRELMRIPDYIQDMHARHHDYVLMGMDLITDEEFASAY